MQFGQFQQRGTEENVGRLGRPDADVAASARDSSDTDVKDVHDDASEGSSAPARGQERIVGADEVV